MDVVVHTNDYGIANKDSDNDEINIRIYAKDRTDIPYIGIVELENKYSMALLDILHSVHDTDLARSEATFDNLNAMFQWIDVDNSQGHYRLGQTDYNLCFTFLNLFYN